MFARDSVVRHFDIPRHSCGRDDLYLSDKFAAQKHPCEKCPYPRYKCGGGIVKSVSQELGEYLKKGLRIGR